MLDLAWGSRVCGMVMTGWKFSRLAAKRWHSTTSGVTALERQGRTEGGSESAGSDCQDPQRRALVDSIVFLICTQPGSIIGNTIAALGFLDQTRRQAPLHPRDQTGIQSTQNPRHCRPNHGVSGLSLPPGYCLVLVQHGRYMSSSFQGSSTKLLHPPYKPQSYNSRNNSPYCGTRLGSLPSDRSLPELT